MDSELATQQSRSFAAVAPTVAPTVASNTAADFGGVVALPNQLFSPPQLLQLTHHSQLLQIIRCARATQNADPAFVLTCKRRRLRACRHVARTFGR